MYNFNIVLLDFKSHFRVEKSTYERLIQDLGPHLNHELVVTNHEDSR